MAAIVFNYFCHMMTRCILLAFCLFTFSFSFAQEKWSLEKCVDYAIENNISVKQTDLQSQFSALAFKAKQGITITIV